ncbi:MAG: HAD family hydrolase, partial [Verrucomicrobiota bacterium]
KSSERSAINEQLRTSGIDAQVVYSSQRDLDVLPAKANKGNASTFLQRRLGLDDVPLIVAGDSGNDISLFEAEDARGIVVSNAESSLMKAASSPPHFHASEPCIKGVEQGLAHFLHLSG